MAQLEGTSLKSLEVSMWMLYFQYILPECFFFFSFLSQVVTRLIHLLGEKILGSLQQGGKTHSSTVPIDAGASLEPELHP